MTNIRNLDFDVCKNSATSSLLFDRALASEPWITLSEFAPPEFQVEVDAILNDARQRGLNAATLGSPPSWQGAGLGRLNAIVPYVKNRYLTYVCSQGASDVQVIFSRRGLSPEWLGPRGKGQTLDQLIKRNAELRAEVAAAREDATAEASRQACSDALARLTEARKSLEGSNPNGAKGKQNLKRNVVGKGYVAGLVALAQCECADIDYALSTLRPSKARDEYLLSASPEYKAAITSLESKRARCNQQNSGGGSKSSITTASGKGILLAAVAVVVLILIVRR